MTDPRPETLDAQAPEPRMAALERPRRRFVVPKRSEQTTVAGSFEVAIIEQVVAALQSLDADSRRRAMAYLIDRFADSAGGPDA